MATFREELATDFNYPHINVYRNYCDDVLCGYNVYAQEGYVFYDTEVNDVILDPDTEEEIPVTYYYTIRLFPAACDMNNLTLIAVPCDSVDEDYIY